MRQRSPSDLSAGIAYFSGFGTSGPGLQFIAGIFTSVLGTAIQGIAPIVQSITQIFQGLIDFITNVFAGNWSGAWQGIVSIFSGIVSGIANIFKAPINAIISGINTFINGINGIKIPDWVPASVVWALVFQTYQCLRLVALLKA